MVDFDKVDYEFNIVSDTEYLLEVEYKASGAIFTKALNIAKRKMKVRGVPTIGDSFEIPLRFRKLLYVGVSKHVNKVAKEVKADGVIIQNQRIDKAVFVKKQDYWKILFELRGNYIDNR